MVSVANMRKSIRLEGNDRQAAVSVIAGVLADDLVRLVTEVSRDYDGGLVPGSYETFEDWFIHGVGYTEETLKKAQAGEDFWKHELLDLQDTYTRSRKEFLRGMKRVRKQTDSIATVAAEYKVPFDPDLAIAQAENFVESNPQWDSSSCW